MFIRKIDPANDPAYTKAYQQTEAELTAMPESDVEPIRYDVMASVILALGAMPNVRNLRRKVKAKFGDAAEASLGDLEVVARALGKAHVLHLPTLHGTDVEEMAGELSRIRSVLLLEVQALITRGHMTSSVVAELVGGTSYRGICLDVLQLASLLRRTWSQVAADTGVTMDEIDRAETLANVFSTTLGENEVGTAPSPSGGMRRRAYTRFVRLYDEHRRYATYFHWEDGKVDDVIPPLGAGRGPSKDDDADVIMPPVAPTGAAPTNGAPPVRPGMPGAPPFAAT